MVVAGSRKDEHALGGSALIALRRSLLVAAFSLASCSHAVAFRKNDDERAVRARVSELLTAYAANDPDAVMRMVDPQGVTFYGSDVAELVRSEAELRQLMRDDFTLWRRARFGEPRDLDVRVGEELAAAFFNVDFFAGGGRAIPVRLCTLWRKVGGTWRLTLSANAVPTQGSSAHELAR